MRKLIGPDGGPAWVHFAYEDSTREAGFDPGASLKGISDVIDRGEIVGPRLYQATAVIGQTGGHGDFRLKGQRRLADRTSFRAGELGMTHVVDGRPATLSAARQNLANGADFLKMMMGGGIFSSKDPLQSRQSSDDEIAAVVAPVIDR